jgi:hypothetical protein
MAQWYWMKGGCKQGPVDTARLKRLAHAIGQHHDPAVPQRLIHV